MFQPFKTKLPRQYDEKALKDTLSAIENRMGLRETARLFKVPCMTVARYVKDAKAKKIGRGTKLNAAEERLLVDLPKKKKVREWTTEAAESWIKLLSELEE
ncbi:hypothetical protein RvY_14958-2 [Ramazzottius varieornatus]|uniref:HTH psq-type domain-containing protein n=1 Tax=Ramazzottius varieornatus TaxID=947166 RepID=A0A1D1VWT1_RAMVA|nr:hypothetical protein RvY_14958-2 [Ramazzottius varieornatus]